MNPYTHRISQCLAISFILAEGLIGTSHAAYQSDDTNHGFNLPGAAESTMPYASPDSPMDNNADDAGSYTPAEIPNPPQKTLDNEDNTADEGEDPAPISGPRQ